MPRSAISLCACRPVNDNGGSALHQHARDLADIAAGLIALGAVAVFLLVAARSL